MSTQTEAERLADLLDENWEYHSDLDTQVAAELLRLEADNKALRLKLAEQPAQQETVAWQDKAKPSELVAAEEWDNIDPQWRWMYRTLYTTPQAQPAREWVGLTDEEVDDVARYCVKSGQSVNAAIRDIEAQLKEKNT